MLPDDGTLKTKTTPRRTLLQALRLTILLGLAAGALAGIVAVAIGILARYLFPRSWLPPVVILLLILTFLDRQMIYRLNRVYLDHLIRTRPDRILVGSLAALPSAAGYIYLSSLAVGVYGLLLFQPLALDGLYLTVCSPLAVIVNFVQTGEMTTMGGWAIVTGWLLIRAWLYHPRLDHLAAADRYRQ